MTISMTGTNSYKVDIQTVTNSTTGLVNYRSKKWRILNRFSAFSRLKSLALIVSLLGLALRAQAQSNVAITDLYYNKSYVGTIKIQRLSIYGWAGPYTIYDPNRLKCTMDVSLYGPPDAIDYRINVYSTFKCPDPGKTVGISQPFRDLGTMRMQYYTMDLTKESLLGNIYREMDWCNVEELNDKIIALENNAGLPIACGLPVVAY